jgi:hypothetical protein
MAAATQNSLSQPLSIIRAHKFLCIAAGVEHVGGSMFEYIPSGNAILMKVQCVWLVE